MASGAPAMSARPVTVNAPRRTRRHRRHLGRGLSQVAAVAAMLGLWELFTWGGLLPTDDFPTMTSTVSELVSLLGTSDFWVAVGNTMKGWVLGLGIAVVLAVPIGIAIGSSDLGYRAVRPVIEFLRPIPSVALIPLAVLVFGTGLQSKVFLAAFAAFWVMLIQMLYGVQDTDPIATDTARSFGLGRLERLYRVTLPSALPYAVTGIRLASAVALILSVTAELVIGAPGLGQQIETAHTADQLPEMYALVITTGLLGWLLNLVILLIAKRALFWHASVRETTT